MKYIDTHAHLNFHIYKNDLKDVAEKTKEGDVMVFNVGTQMDTSKKAVELAEEVFHDDSVNKLYKADACYAICYAGYKDSSEKMNQIAIKSADEGIETMLQFIKEEKKYLISC